MRVLLIDPDRARAALVTEGLSDMGPVEVREAQKYEEAEARAFEPDLVIVACDSPDRDTIESLKEAGATNPRPVVMFVDRSAPGVAEAALQAGVAAYIVDGLSPSRVRPILEVAMTRFSLMQDMRSELARAKASLASRRAVERAKGLLMKERGLDEEGAYRVLRKLAMDKSRPIGSVAEDLIAFSEVLRSGT